jgi:cyclopropane-fatty-acyl-phospholipid synthase
MNKNTNIADDWRALQPAASGSAYRVVEELLAHAGVRLNGNNPWDIRLLHPGVPERALAYGTLGLGEAYMDGYWECERLDQLFERLIRARLADKVQPMSVLWHALRNRLLNRQTQRRAWQLGRQHYDLSNEFYRAMLDRRMTYTCGYWHGAGTLDEAQENKLDLICRKLALQPGMRVLDIGCGWGSFMKFAAQRYGVQCVGVTISAEQVALGRELCQGLPVQFQLQDYRTMQGKFDRIVSVGMFEHVGQKNYRAYMEVAHQCLEDGGLFLLHTIGRNEHGYGTDPWIDKYIFPNGELPTIAGIGRACERLFVVEDLHNFGADYDRTLMDWHANFEAAWPRFADSLGERFHRMWRYYLLCCAGAFRARNLQLWQWVLAKDGVPGGWRRLEDGPGRIR